MRTCQSCGRENPDDRDFCQCGEYLNWEPTGFVEAVTPEMAAAAAAEAAAPATPAPAAPAQPGAAPPTSGAAPPPAPAPVAAGPAGTQVHAAAPPPAAPVQAPEEPEHEAATITLRLPEDEAAKGETLAVGVYPGDRTRVRAMIRNQSGIVDNYQISVTGLPDEWFSVLPDTVYLVPYGTGGTYEQEVEIHLHPPRKPEAEARIWELVVTAHSKAQERTAATAPLMLGIQPFEQHDTKVKPERGSGRRKTDFKVAVANKANAPVYVAFAAKEADDDLDFRFTPPGAEIAPGETIETRMRVRPPKQIWIGRPHERRIDVQTKTGEEAQAIEAQAFEEEAEEQEGADGEGVRGKLKGKKIPGMYGPQVYKPQVYKPNINLGPGGIQASKPMVRGPQVRGPQARGMNLNLNNLKMPGGQAPPAVTGPLLPTQAVFRQKPWLPWWVAIVIPLLALLALLLFLFLPKNVEVPDVVGSSATEAGQALAEADLDRGPDRRKESDRRPGTVLDQEPDAGTKVDEHQAVVLTVAVGNARRRVPDVTGLTLRAAQRALNDRGFELGQVEPFDADPDLRIRLQDPRAGELWRTGTSIDLALGPKAKPPSNKLAPGPGEGDPAPGAPSESNDNAAAEISSDLAFGDARLRVLVRRASGGRRSVRATEAGQPTWTPDGRLAYLTGPDRDHVHVLLQDPTRPGEGDVLTDDGPYHRPAFSPEGDVLVIVRDDGSGSGAGTLCFAPVPAEGALPDCQPADAEWAYGRPAWSPDGATLMALARGPSDTAYTRVVLFQRQGTDGSFADAWQLAPQPVRERPYIHFAAWAPEGIALLESSSPSTAPALVLFGPSEDGTLERGKEVSAITGCQVAWEPTGRLAVAERGCSAFDSDGPIRLVDPSKPDADPIVIATGRDPAWRPAQP